MSNGLLKDLDRYPEVCPWKDWREEGRKRLVAAQSAELALELREPTTNSVELREATVREALARILERKP